MANPNNNVLMHLLVLGTFWHTKTLKPAADSISS